MKRIPLILATLLCFATTSGVLAHVHKPTQRSVLTGRNGRHSFLLTVAIGPLRRDKHKITRVRVSGWMQWPQLDGEYELKGFRMDKDGTIHSQGGMNQEGKNWYGTDGGLPYEEFYTFDVVVDGKRWKIPARLYSKCYDPNINLRPHPLLWAWLSPDGKRLTVKMHGSDGAGSYGVLWYLRHNGKHSRKIYSLS